MSQQCHFIPYQKVTSSIHDNFCEDIGCSLFVHECGVDNGDAFKSDRECLSEGQELQINLRELNVEFPEVLDVVSEQLLNEVRLYELMLQGVLTIAQQVFEGVLSYLVLLHIGVN